MSAPTTSHNRTSTVAQYIYRTNTLEENFVRFVLYAEFVNHPQTLHLVGQVDSMLQFLETPLDTTVMISPERIRAMRLNREIIVFQDAGYRDTACVEMAFELRAIAEMFREAIKIKWLNFFSPLWNFFDMENTFSSR